MVDLRWQGPPGLQHQRAQVVGLQVGGVLPDRHQALAPRQDPRHGQAQDRGQVMTHSPPIPRIDHAPKNLPQGLARGALVVEDDIAARPPVIEDDLDTTYRPGGAAPHPRQHAENPERQTTSHRLCRAPGGGGRRHTAGRRRPDVGREAPEPRERTAETAPCSIAGRGSAVRRSGREALIRWTMVHRSGRYNRRRSRGGCPGSRSTPP